MDKRKKNLLWQAPLLLFLVVGTIFIIRQQQNMPYQHHNGMIFGTTYSVTYQCADNLQADIEERMKEVDQTMSMFNPQSTISRINRSEDIEVSDMFLDVFHRAMQISSDTDGAFDITVAPLVNAWGFGFHGASVSPSRQQVDSLREIVGWQKVKIEGRRVVKENPHLMLDCSAIAKGYGVDHVAALLESRGIKNFMVEIGGEVITRGISPKRLPWKIGVVKPTDDTLATLQEYQTILNITDRAMATSGNYRNFYYRGGKKYAHTIDPLTGYPVQHNILSATVLADDCATADAYATAFMVMGLERAKQLLERHKELMAYIIYSDQQGQLSTWFSPSLSAAE